MNSLNVSKIKSIISCQERLHFSYHTLLLLDLMSEDPKTQRYQQHQMLNPSYVTT